MSDPFLPANGQNQLIREAKIGFSIVLLVACTLGYWGWVQYQSVRRSIPDHVREAPVARHVGPDEYLSHLTEQVSDVGAANLHPQNAAPRPPVATQVAVTSGGQTKDASANPAPKPTTSESLMGDINGNIEQLNEIAQSFIGLRNTATEPPQPSKPVVASSNPISKPAAEDLSRRLEPWNKSNQQAAANHFASKSEPDATTNKPRRDDENQFPAAPLRQDSMVTPVSFDEVNVRTESSGPATDFDPQPVEPSVDQTADEQLVLQVIDPPRNPTVDSSSVTRPASESLPADDEGDEFRGRKYRIQAGDTWWSVAQEKYGDGGYFRALFECNRGTIEQFESLDAGQTISTPAIDVLRNRFPEMCRTMVDAEANCGQIYTTQAGDTLFGIARQTMGQASRYLELLQLNRDRLGSGTDHLTRLPVNLELRLPLR